MLCGCWRRKKKQETEQHAPREINRATNAPNAHVFIHAHDELHQEPQTLSPRHHTFNRSLYAPMPRNPTIYEDAENSGGDQDHDGTHYSLQGLHARQATPSEVSVISPDRQQSLSAATVGVDTTGDGHANYTYTGVDLYHDGVPDVLQVHHVMQAASPVVMHDSPRMNKQSPLEATLGVDVTGDGHANLEVPTIMPEATPGVSQYSPHTPSHNFPTATVGVDTTGDGHSNYIYAVIPTGIPDSLQVPHVRQTALPGVVLHSPTHAQHSLTATVGVDITGDGHANYTYVGLDRNHDGIPDALQCDFPPVRQAHHSGVFLQSPHMQIPHPPTAAVAVDTTGDGHANYIYAGVDQNHDGIPDAFQVPHVRGSPVGSFALPSGYSLRRS